MAKREDSGGEDEGAGNASASADAGANAPSDAPDPKHREHEPPGTPPPLPSVSLPKGGGAIRGIGEKFGVEAATGTATLTIPLPLSPGRGSATPQLQLGYDSGRGNGPFGFGWAIDAAAITRKTDKGLPRYDDANESDVFVLAGAEDLVPILDDVGARPAPVQRTVHGVAYEIHRYRPRIEGAFTRIERWRDTATGESHFRTITRENVTAWFGTGPESRIADPDDPRRIFSYLLARTVDPRGNLVEYGYVPDDERDLDRSSAHEANRTSAARKTQRYLKSIRHAHTAPYFADYAELGAASTPPGAWHFELVLDYGDHAPDAPVPTPDRAWPVRPDPFSSYRAGFEVRTYRRCHRVLAFHHFPDQPGVGNDCLVRALELAYADEVAGGDPHAPIYTFIASATLASFRRDGNGYVRAAQPPVQFEYTAATLSGTVQTLAADNLPEGLGPAQQWLDLDGDGCGGVLQDAAGAWTYQRNQSPLSAPAVQFGGLQPLPSLPSQVDVSAHRFLDLVGDGRLAAAQLDGPTPGYHARGWSRDWQPHRTFDALPQIPWRDPNVRLVDLTGDGRADALLTEDHRFTLWRSRGSRGFAPPEHAIPPWDEDRGPAVVLADGSDTIFLADMTGDGLSDLVRVRDGEVSYWPNLGYGRFGARVAMDGAPRFTDDVAFDPRRVRLADIDGSGSADLLYLGADGVWAWFNQSGNAWSAPVRVTTFPSSSTAATVQVVDLFGTGTACLVWSSPLPGDAGAPVRYVDLMGGSKPHLLTRIVNNLGAETRLSYAPSSRFYLADERAGTPWITRLPHVVHVVERVETYDWIGRSRFVTRRAYHHGYFDGPEREFRGFGMVETWDTEEHTADDAFAATNWDAASWIPPVHTKTWLHVGAFGALPAISRQHAAEYWVEPALRGDAHAADRTAMELPDSTIASAQPLLAQEVREAYRALKGRVLRTELYAADGSARAASPYQVTEATFEVRCVQPRGPNRHAVFTVHERERLGLDYERADADPRVSHAVTLEVDAFLDVKRQVTIGYPRRPGAALDPALPGDARGRLAYDQARLHVSAAQSVFTADLADPALHPDAHRTPLPAEEISAELLGIAPASARPGVTNLFRFAELDAHWQTAWDGAHDLPAEEVAASDVDGAGSPAMSIARRLGAHGQTQYRAADLSGLLPLYAIDELALPGQTFQLAVTAALRARAIDPRADDAAFTEGGYVARGADWWIASGRAYLSPGDGDNAATELAYARAHFYTARRLVDAFGGITRVALDSYDLLPVGATDAVGNTTSAANDYRVLQAALVTDPNGNQSQVAFDTRGKVVATAVLGKAGESGDSLAGLAVDLDDATLLAHVADPFANPAALLGAATSRIAYDLFAYARSGAPPVSYTIARETHVADLAPGTQTRYRHALAYSDGFARIAQAKAQAADDGGPRWIGTGWTIFNNKGKPVRQYEPFFTATPAFEFAAAVGVSSTMIYDALGRASGALHPDATWTKVVRTAWRVEQWDASDTALLDPRGDPDLGDAFARQLAGGFTSWFAARSGGALGADAQDAAVKTAAHAGTPGVVHLDSLARACLAVADNGVLGLQCVRTARGAGTGELAVFDALGRRVREGLARSGAAYISGADFAGRPLHAVAQDGGARRTLSAVDGVPLRLWDDRNQAFRFAYDAARRATHAYVKVGAAGEILLERTIYGEGLAAQNLCGRTFRHYDASGVAASDHYDLAGNLVASSRRLARAFVAAPSWAPIEHVTDAAALDVATAGLLQDETFAATTRWDALGRALQATTPASSTMKPNVICSSYDAGGHLLRLDVYRQQAAAPAGLLDPAAADLHAVTSVTYNARGQRIGVAYGNGAITAFTYDPLTFRLVRLVTTRPIAPVTVQDLAYSYDATGHITRIRDAAQQTAYFANGVVDPSTDYTYDATYRLIAATGREHIGQTGAAQVTDDDGIRTNLPAPGDAAAVAAYTETYTHDLVGNLRSVVHTVAGGTWTRGYAYAEPSRIVPGETGNRLTATSLPGDDTTYSGTYQHDPHGNMTRMPHLPLLVWDERDRLRSTTRQVVAAGVPETTYYTYDAGGTRMRKVTAATAADATSARVRYERIYLGAVELYREYDATGAVSLARETLPLVAGQRVALVETRTAGTDKGSASLVRYQHANHIQSALLELDAGASIITYEEYFPFGSTAYQSVRDQNETPKRYRFTGKERDEETGLTYHGLRYCAPWLGRWTACDPAGLVDGTCVYAYVRNNPIGLSDPSGAQGHNHHHEERGQRRQPRTGGGHHGHGHGQTRTRPLTAAEVQMELIRLQLAYFELQRQLFEQQYRSLWGNPDNFRDLLRHTRPTPAETPVAPVAPTPAAPTAAPPAHSPDPGNLGGIGMASPVAGGQPQGALGANAFGSNRAGGAQIAVGISPSDRIGLEALIQGGFAGSSDPSSFAIQLHAWLVYRRFIGALYAGGGGGWGAPFGGSLSPTGNFAATGEVEIGGRRDGPGVTNPDAQIGGNFSAVVPRDQTVQAGDSGPSAALRNPGLLSGSLYALGNLLYGRTGGSKVPALTLWGEVIGGGAVGGDPQPVTTGGTTTTNSQQSWGVTGTAGATVNLAPLGNWFVLQLGIFGGVGHSEATVTVPGAPPVHSSSTVGNFGGGAGAVFHF